MLFAKKCLIKAILRRLFLRQGLQFLRGCGIFLLFDDDFIGKWAVKVRFLFMIGKNKEHLHGKTAKQRRCGQDG